MKAIILSCNMGAGHNSAAKAVQEQFANNGVEAPILDALSFASESMSRFACNVYAKAATTIPNIFGVCYRAAESMSNPRVRSASYLANMTYAHKLYRYLRENKVDTIVTAHIFPTQCLTYIRKRYRLPFKLYMVCTDYDVCPFLEETSADAYFIPHDELISAFTHRGIEGTRCVTTGIPTGSRFSANTSRAGARAALGLPADVPMILIMSGAMGFGHVQDAVGELCRQMPPETHIVVLAGNNTRLKTVLRTKYGRDERIHIMDFTTQADLYMDACDVMMTKPGGLSSTEAAVKGVPLVHTDPIPGCETDNLRFFADRGMSVTGGSASETAAAAVALLTDADKKAAMIRAQQANTNPNSAADIVRYVLENR